MGKTASTRFERSAAALRENLKRRKRSAVPKPPPSAAPEAAKTPPQNTLKQPQ